MSRRGMAKLRPRQAGGRPVVETLEGRLMPTVGFISGFGVGVIGQYSTIHSNAVATDSAGDTFITGSFRGSVSFDPGSSSGNFTTNNTQDAFVAKYSPIGTMIWARTFAARPLPLREASRLTPSARDRPSPSIIRVTSSSRAGSAAR